MSTATFTSIKRKFNFSIQEELFQDEEEEFLLQPEEYDEQLVGEELSAVDEWLGYQEEDLLEEEGGEWFEGDEEDFFMEFTRTISFDNYNRDNLSEEEETDSGSTVIDDTNSTVSSSSSLVSDEKVVEAPLLTPAPSTFGYPAISRLANDVVVRKTHDTMASVTNSSKKAMTRLQVELEPAMEAVCVPREWMRSSWSVQSRDVLRCILEEGLLKYPALPPSAFHRPAESPGFLFWVLQTLVGRKEDEAKHNLAKPNLYWTERRFLDALVLDAHPGTVTEQANEEDKEKELAKNRMCFRAALEELLWGAQELGKKEAGGEKAGMMRRAEVLLALHVIHSQGSTEQKKDYQDLVTLKLGAKKNDNRASKLLWVQRTQAIVEVCTMAVDTLRLSEERKELQVEVPVAEDSLEVLIDAQTRLFLMFQRYLDDHKHGAFDTAFLTATHFASALSTNLGASAPSLVQISDASRRWWNLALVEGFGGRKWLEMPLLLEKPCQNSGPAYARFVWAGFTEEEKAALLHPDSFGACYTSIPDLVKAVNETRGRSMCRNFAESQVEGTRYGWDLVTSLRDATSQSEDEVSGWSHNIAAFAQLFREEIFAVPCFRTMCEEEDNYPGFQVLCRKLFPMYLASCCTESLDSDEKFAQLVSETSSAEEITAFLRWLGFLKPQEELTLHKMSQMERGARQTILEQQKMAWVEFEGCFLQCRALETTRNDLSRLEDLGRDGIAAEGLDGLGQLFALIRNGPIRATASRSLDALLVDQCPAEEKARREERIAELRRKRQEQQQQQQGEEGAVVETDNLEATSPTSSPPSVWSNPPRISERTIIQQQEEEDDDDDDFGMGGLF